jgi:Fe2+ or Zn2+ uptake regulation protein
MKKLTKKQVEIMKIFWASEHPLAASDILKLDESMNINTIRAEFTESRLY